MAKIPTYQSKRTVSGNIIRPSLPDYSFETATKFTNIATKVAQSNAAQAGYESGEKAQQELLKKNQVELLEGNNFSISGKAYNKGATAAFVANRKNFIDAETTKLERELLDATSDQDPKNRYKDWQTKSTKLKNDFMATLPSQLQADLGGYADSIIQRSDNKVYTFQQNYNVSEMQADVTTRTENFIETMPSQIDLTFGGYKDNLEFEMNFADTLAAIEGIANVNPALAAKLKEQVYENLQTSVLQYEYKQADDKSAFINDVRNGGEKYSEIMGYINDAYFEGEEKALEPNQLRSTANFLQSLLDNDTKQFAVDRAKFDTEFTTSINNLKIGVDPNYTFDAQKAKELGFSDVQILKFEKEFELAQATFPEISAAKFVGHRENKNKLDDLNGQLAELSNKENKTQQDREDILVLTAQIQGIQQIRNTQLKAIQDGNPDIILTQANISFDTSTAEGIKDYHEKLATFGIDNTITNVVPQDQIDTDKSALLEGGFENFVALQQKYGVYFDKFLVDADLVGSSGYQTINMLSKTSPDVAASIFQAIEDAKVNKDNATKLAGGSEAYNALVKDFTNKFLTEYKDYLVGNQQFQGDMLASVEAFYHQIYVNTEGKGDPDKFIMSQIDKAFNKFEYKGMKILLPRNIDANKVTENLEQFITSPQKYGIRTSTFDINDFKQDIDDNNIDNYSLTFDGGEIKIVQNDNALGVATIYTKKQSGQNEVIYSDNIVLDKPDETKTTVETNSYESTWEYDKGLFNDILDSKFADIEKQTVGTQDEINDINTQIENIDKEIADLTAKSKVPEMLAVIIQPLEMKKAMLAGQLEQLNANKKVSLDDRMFELESSFLKATVVNEEKTYIDDYVQTLESDTAQHGKLQAISYYIKDGTMTEWVLDYLEDLQSFETIKNNPAAKKFIIENWQNNMERTTVGTSPNRMTPLEALYDFVQDYNLDNNELEVKPIDKKRSFGQILMDLD
jgi:hypothetical protein